MAEDGEVCRLDAVPRCDCLIHWDRDTAASASILDGVAMVKPNAKSIDLYDVEIAATHLPPDIFPSLSTSEREIEALFE